MTPRISPGLQSARIALALGALVMVPLALLGGQLSGASIAHRLEGRAAAAIYGAGGAGLVRAQFISATGVASRHPVLVGGAELADSARARIARAVGRVPGVGAVRWSDSGMLTEAEAQALTPLSCEEQVGALLRNRTIRFEEGSARIDQASRPLVDEVAAALRPCLGNLISITGHTDHSGSEPGNLALSRERASAVRDALVARGIPEDGLRVRGLGSREPAEGLEPADPANRRIEFAVIASQPLAPTPVDTPGPR